jgi:hypothetical protein
MARLIYKESDGSLRTLDVGFSASRLGRAPDNDLVIDHVSVSLHHCEVALDGSDLTVRDLKSTNGTYLDGEAVDGTLRTTSARRLRLGTVDLQVEYSDARIFIPEFKSTSLPPVVIAPATGKGVCQKHQERPAVWQCPHCQRLICPLCIHRIKLTAGRTHYLCPDCSHHAELLPDYRKGGKRSVLGRLKAGMGKSFGAFKKFLADGPTTQPPPDAP